MSRGFTVILARHGDGANGWPQGSKVELRTGLCTHQPFEDLMTTEHSIFGWYDHPDQAIPTYDPGRAALCPICLVALGQDAITTTSLMREGSTKSFFFRAHKSCWLNASDADKEQIEHSIIDA